MVNVAIFVSGNGSNLENIIQEINNGHVNDVAYKVLITDKEHAYTRERAEKLHIPYVYVNPRVYAGKEPYEQKILSILKEHQVELIVLAGYMRLAGKVLPESFLRCITNLCPAYLPNFPRVHGAQDAYKAKVDFTGVTVHFADEGVNTGGIIHQGKITTNSTRSLETLEEYVHVLEYDMFPKVVKHVCKMIESEET